MLAYHNKPELAAEVLATIQAHHDHDDFVQGQYWENGKGCAVGCLSKNPEGGHMDLQEKYNIPVMIYRLEDRIFEGLPNDQAKHWPLRFTKSTVKVCGKDLSRIGFQFLHWLLTDELKVVGEGKIYDDVRAAIKQCADVLVPLKEGGQVDMDAAYAAARAADAAVYAAARAADAAADAAARAADAAAYKRMGDKLIELIEAA
jgi:hypothetical protein